MKNKKYYYNGLEFNSYQDKEDYIQGHNMDEVSRDEAIEAYERGIEMVEQYINNYSEFTSFDDFQEYCQKNGLSKISDSQYEEIGRANESEAMDKIREAIREYIDDIDEYMNNAEGEDYDGDDFLSKKYS